MRNIKRDVCIDMLKGFLGIMVVIGHVIIEIDEEPFINPLVRFCYSFHMFLFMFLGGYLIALKKHDFNWLTHRAKRLLIPYFIWSIIIILFQNKKISTNTITILIFEPVIWYLIVLFLCDLLLFICCNIEMKVSKLKIDIFIGLFFILILNILYVLKIHGGFRTLNMLAIYFPYYFAGYFFRTREIHIKKIPTILVLFLYPLSMLFFGYIDHSKEITLFTNFLNLFNFTIEKQELFLRIFASIIIPIYNHYIVPPLGCCFFISIFKFISLKTNITFLSFIGKYTMQLYIMAYFFFFTPFTNTVANEIFASVISIIIVILISLIIEKFKKLNLILFGY